MHLLIYTLAALLYLFAWWQVVRKAKGTGKKLAMVPLYAPVHTYNYLRKYWFQAGQFFIVSCLIVVGVTLQMEYAPKSKVTIISGELPQIDVVKEMQSVKPLEIKTIDPIILVDEVNNEPPITITEPVVIKSKMPLERLFLGFKLGDKIETQLAVASSKYTLVGLQFEVNETTTIQLIGDSGILKEIKYKVRKLPVNEFNTLLKNISEKYEYVSKQGNASMFKYVEDRTKNQVFITVDRVQTSTGYNVTLTYQLDTTYIAELLQ